MRYLPMLLCGLLTVGLYGCGAAVDGSGNVVADEVVFTPEGQPLSPFTLNPVDPYTNHDIEKDQRFRWVEKSVPCFACEGAGELPAAKVIALKDPLRTCMLCNGVGFLTYGEQVNPMAPPKAGDVAATPSRR